MNGGFDWQLQFTWKPTTDDNGDKDRDQPMKLVVWTDIQKYPENDPMFHTYLVN